MGLRNYYAAFANFIWKIASIIWKRPFNGDVEYGVVVQIQNEITSLQRICNFVGYRKWLPFKSAVVEYKQHPIKKWTKEAVIQDVPPFQAILRLVLMTFVPKKLKISFDVDLGITHLFASNEFFERIINRTIYVF